MTASSAKSGDRARVTVAVAVAPRDAFEIFTDEIDQWWRRGPKFRFVGGRAGVVRFEGTGEARRLVETLEDGSLFEIGRVLAWEPGARLVFEWRGRNFSPNELTEVEVKFEPQGERGERTLVTLEHRGWSSLRPGHPARHGKEAAEAAAMIAMWWADLARALVEHAAKRGGAKAD